MKASPYDWEMLYITSKDSFETCTEKLRERKWDVVMVGSKCPFFLCGGICNRGLKIGDVSG